MNKQTWLMVFSGSCLLAGMPEAAAHDHGSSSMQAAACSSCHSGGAAPRVEFSTELGTPFAGNRLTLKKGASVRLFLHLDTQPGMGVGLVSRIPAELTLRSEHSLTRVERGVLFHRTTMVSATGRNPLDLRLTANSGAACGSSLLIPVYAAAVNRNRAPSGDGAAQTVLQVWVECDAGAQSAEPAAQAPAPVKSLDNKLAAPVREVPAATARATQIDAGAPSAPLRAAVTLTPRLLESQGARLTLAPPGEVNLRFAMGAKHVVIDCRVRSLPGVRFSTRDGNQALESELSVAGQDGHFYTVVPGHGLARTVHVSISGEGLAPAFQSCTLTPTR